MNRVFQVIWSHAIGAWVVVSEFATRGGRAAQSHDARGNFARHRLVFALLLTLGPCSGAWAQTYYWDGTDTTADANGGNGTWQDGVANWDNASTAGASVAWSNASPADALFAFNPGTVTIAPGGVFAHSLQSLTLMTFNGGTLTLTGPIVDIRSNTTINSVVAGSVGLTKTGNAMLTLGGANTYTGVTQLQAGTLRVGNTSALGAAANNASNFVVSSGTTLDLQANLDRHLTANGAFTISGNGSTWSGAPTLTASATMSASGITQTGAWTNSGANLLSVRAPGSLVLSGNNTYSGATTLTSGVLAINSATGLSANSNLVIAGTFNATQWNAAIGLTPVSGSFTRAVGAGDGQVRWSGSGGFASVGTGTQAVNLGGAGAQLEWGVTPDFIATGNVLQLGTGNHALGGGTLDFQNALRLPTAGTNYDVSTYNGIVGGTNARAKISGVISGAGNLRVIGSTSGAPNGMLELSGANTYTGDLVLASAGAYGNVLLNHANAASVDGGINLVGPANSTGNTLSLTYDFTRALGTGANQIRWTGYGGFSAAFANHFVNLGGNGDPVTWASGGFVPNGSVFNLAATNAGNAEIDFRNPINFNNAVRTINVGLGGTARLSGVLSNGGVTYQGGGQVTVSGTNTYAGVTTISSANVVASTIGNGGTNGNLGAATNAAANLVFNAGTLTYTGAGDTSDRNFTATGNATLFANGTGALSLGGATAGAGTRTLLLRGTSAASLVNQLTGVISNTGGGVINLQKTDTNTWRLGNVANTYTGATTLNGGVLEATNLQNGGVASSLGMSSNAASNVHINNGTLRYVGAGGSTDRAMTLDNSGGFESSGTGAIAFTSSGAMVNTGASGQATVTFTLGGSNAGANRFSAALGDIVSANNESMASTGLAKSGTGAWTINAAAPTFTGNTTLNGGVLWAEGTGAVTGGFGKTSNAALHATYVVSTPMSSLLMFNGGVLGLTATSGDFERGLTQQARSFNNNGTVGVGNRGDDRFVRGVRWTGSGGFAAIGANRSVNIGGNAAPTDLAWNTLGFVGTGQSLMFGHASADSTVAFLNAIEFGGFVRSVDVADGSAAVDAELRGALTGAGASGLQKLGAGTLLLSANNTYAGATQINAGTLQIGNGGTTGTLGTGAVSLAASATLAFDRSNTYSVAQAITGSGWLSQRGTGTTTLLASNSAGTVEVTGGTLDVNGTLLGDTLRMGNGTLNVDGMFRANAGGTANLVTVGGTDSVLRVTAGGTLRAGGSLGDGRDSLVLDGALDVAAGGLDFGDGVDVATLSGDLDGAGSLAFGNGDDTLTIDDGTDLGGFTGVFDGGAQDIVDTLRLDIAGALTLGPGKVVNWEALVKDNAGVATLQGANTFQSTSVKAGTLAIEGDFTTQTLSMSDGATLDLDGTLGAAAGTRTTIDGSAGANTIVVANGSTLRATGDLGDGADTLDLAGTLDIGGGSFSLGAGDDIFRTHDTTAVLGNLDAGAGNDMLDVVVNTGFTVPFGGLTGFESLGKSGAGTMQVNGPASFDAVRVGGGLLSVNAGGSVVARATSVETGATLDIAGTFAGTTDADTFDIAGTVTGGAPILLDTGDDTLVLRDGANLGVVVDGGAQGIGDRIVLQSDAAMTFDGADATNFEFLDKRGAGEATVTGALAYGGGAQLQAGTLIVDGVLAAPTMSLSDDTHLRVDGTAEGSAGAAATLLGSVGANTVTIAAGATLHAAGDLGDGNDLLDVAGTLDTGGGTFALGAGDDTFRTHDTTNVIGDLDAGAGSDLLDVAVASGNTVVFGGLAGFESLGKSGAGTMEVDGPARFDAIVVGGGMLDITAPASVATQSLTLSSGATLRVDGNLSGTAGDDVATIAGVLLGAGTFDLGDGDDRLVVQDGADFGGLPAPVDGGAGNNRLVTDIAATATLGGIANFQSLAKTNVGTLHVDGASGFANVDVVGGTLEIGSAGAITGLVGGPLSTRVGAGATLLVGGAYGAGDTVLLDVASTFAFDAGDTVQFERLRKTGAGEATIEGTGEFTQDTQLQAGSLVVSGALSTPSMRAGANTTLRVTGMLSSVDGAATQLTGTGANTVQVGAGATAFLAGDLGDGADVLDVAGTLDTRGGTLFLGAGDDTLVVEDASHIVGLVDGGDGADTLVTDIATQASLGAASNFDALLKTGAGVLDVDGALPSAFGVVNVQDGRLHVAGDASLVGVHALTIARGARMQVDGGVVGTAGSDLVDVGGIVDGAGRVDLGEGDDRLLLRDAADTRGLLTALDGGAGFDTVDAQVDAGALALGRTVNFEGLLKSGDGALGIEHDATFDATLVDAARSPSQQARRSRADTRNSPPAPRCASVAASPARPARTPSIPPGESSARWRSATATIA